MQTNGKRTCSLCCGAAKFQEIKQINSFKTNLNNFPCTSTVTCGTNIRKDNSPITSYSFENVVEVVYWLFLLFDNSKAVV